jgi:S-formylglutathione hydrolase
MQTSIETLSRHACFGGTVGFYRHEARTTRCPMKFSVYMPPRIEKIRLPVLYYLAGLTCTEETFMIKSGAQRLAAQLGLLLVAPDTSPRVRLPGDDLSWDFGLGASFYVDALQEPWAAHYQMYSYLTEELPVLIGEHFPADTSRQGIFGHSMGGHGALTIALRNPSRYRSVSAFAPIAAPMRCPWGEKAFSGYLGPDRTLWEAYDPTALVATRRDVRDRPEILIDQGFGDQFLERQLHPHLFEAACRQVGYPLKLRYHRDYDHGYYFISTFIDDHLQHHRAALRRS